jgi:HK97 family phage portal protein
VFLTDFKAAEDRSPYSNFWFEPVGVHASSDVRVTSDSALQLSAVYACVSVLSSSFAMLPPVFYKKNGRNREIITDHWLYNLLAKRPNRYQNAYEWREMMQGHLVLRGNAFNQIIANSRGQITELLPISPDFVTIKVQDGGDYFYRIKQHDKTERDFARGEIWHLKGLAPDIYQGYSPLSLARESIGIGLAAQGYGSRFFANDARPPGWIEFPGQFKDREAKQAFRSSWQEQQGGNNRGAIAVLDMGMKYHPVGISNADAQFLESRKFNVEEIARLFGVPPHRIGELSRSTNNNIEHQGLEFVTYTMTPWAERWEHSIENDLLPDGDEIDIEFDFKNLLRGDAKSRAAYYHTMVLDGVITRNEARADEGLNPIEGLDEPLMPLNMQTTDEAEEAADLEESQPDINE